MANLATFKDWLAKHNGGFHPHVRFVEELMFNEVKISKVPSGSAVVADADLPADIAIVECPFDLVITEELAQKCLLEILDLRNELENKTWTERQWISSYLCAHWIVEGSRHLLHDAYLNTLPSAEKLRTPLHFTALELELFQGTNLYGATLDREKEWRAEWNQCKSAFSRQNADWGDKFSWSGNYPSTYLSSRAFPSSLLSPKPTLLSSPNTKPILLPGIDALNHGRKEPVTWAVSYPPTNSTSESEGSTQTPSPKISLVLHNPSQKGQELLNNYGAKPNSELILGYGFALPQNPDDTMVLKIGGLHQKWEIGRAAKGAEGLWNEILRSVQQDPEETTYEDQLDAASALLDMLKALLDRFPPDRDERRVSMRPEVSLMLDYYLEGQKEIVDSLADFAREKERIAIEQARAEGIEVVLED
ncbi:hypothetical protein H0H93_006741 [Arthromyces matolae]|nr:hypothetical protein H0H93_006741 [Arthromyces matolae]